MAEVKPQFDISKTRDHIGSVVISGARAADDTMAVATNRGAPDCFK
jgi:hypothetical protein